ncbi:MAG: DNA polymerase III subunit delta [Clostridia bacterium]|nr:DNA polymerase III subunit delta [Clostridia bacterium]
MTIAELEKTIKENNLSSIYLLYGKETFLLETNLKRIKKCFGELKEGLNYIKLENASSDNIIVELQTPPFGFEKKLIIVKDSELFKKQGKKKSTNISDEIDKLVQFLDDDFDSVKDQNIIIFIEEEVDKNALYKEIDKIGVVCGFEPEKPQDIAKRMKFICNSYHVNIDGPTLGFFIEECGTDLQDLINEIRKLIEYAGKDGTITKEDIDALCIKKFESVIFDLTDSLGQKNVKKALEVLKGLIYAKEPIQKILVTLYNHFKKLYIVKLCEKYKEDVLANLNLKPNQTFLVSKYKRQAGYFTEDDLRMIVIELINLDESYKMGNSDLNIGLETILCRYCSK